MMDSKRMEIRKEDKVSKKFVWFHATSLNGGAMCIAATIISYFSLYVQETVGITAAISGLVVLIMVFYPIRKYFPAIAEKKDRIAEEKSRDDNIRP